MSFTVRNARRAQTHHSSTPAWQVQRDTERGPCFATDETRRDSLTLQALRAFCDVNNRQLDFANTFGEPGYTDPEKCILLADWNDIPKSLQDRLESQGYELEWSDEWYVDHNNGSKAWRTQPDSMCWEPRTRLIDGDILTPDSDAQEWIQTAVNDEDNALPSWFDTDELERIGYGKSATGHDPSNRLRNVFKEFRAEGFDVILVNARRYEYDVWTRREAKRECFLSDARGIYIPHDWANMIDRERVTGVTAEDFAILEAGPDHELYWDVWSDVLDNAEATDDSGTVWRFEQDGDCWMVEKAGEHCDADDNVYVTHE
jgi:hypothetical protein